MANAKEIRTQIKSIKNTQKITKAMEMVAASKMRKAQDRMAASRPYAEKMRNVIGHLADASSDFTHPYLAGGEDVKKVGIIVVATDRGLCGGLNINLFRKTLQFMQEQEKAGVEVELSVIGRKAGSFFRGVKANIVASKENLGDTPHLVDIIGAVKVMLDSFDNGDIDRLYMANNSFVNTMTQSPDVKQVLPVVPVTDEELPQHWDYLYEPAPAELLDGVLKRYVESQVYQAAVDNVACEMAARMVAMKAASDNAGNLIEDLQLVYNKARQAAITTELTEIVAGAAAV
jgi:F-type H+-transporting ATPase subunit gamma